MAFSPRPLGRTGRSVGPLGLGASYGVGGADLEHAFERGCNYLYWGSARRRGFRDGLRAIVRRDRASLVLVIQSYARWGWGVRLSLERALRALGTDYADVLLLGWWQDPVPPRVMDEVRRLRERGQVRHLAVSTHRRPLAGTILADAATPFDVVHVRYNAAHRGAEREAFAHRRAGGPGVVAFTTTRWGALCRPIPGVPRTPTAGDCYRFALSHPAVDVCLAGPRDRADLDAALAALARGPMDPDELAWMREAGDRLYARKGEGNFVTR